MRELEEIVAKINSFQQADEISKYCAQHDNKCICVCMNNGQFHKGDSEGVPGFATFMGKFTKKQAIDFVNVMCEKEVT